MGEALHIADPCWLGMLMEWELAESTSGSQQDAGSSTTRTLTYTSAAALDEGEVLSDVHELAKTALIFNHPHLPSNIINPPTSTTSSSFLHTHHTSPSSSTPAHASHYSPLLACNSLEEPIWPPPLPLVNPKSFFPPLNGHMEGVKGEVEDSLPLSALASVRSIQSGCKKSQANAQIELDDILAQAYDKSAERHEVDLHAVKANTQIGSNDMFGGEQAHDTSLERQDANLHMVALPSVRIRDICALPKSIQTKVPHCLESNQHMTSNSRASSHNVLTPSHLITSQAHLHSSTLIENTPQPHNHPPKLIVPSSNCSSTTQNQHFQPTKSLTLSFNPPSSNKHYGDHGDSDDEHDPSSEFLFDPKLMSMERFSDADYHGESFGFGGNMLKHKKVKRTKIEHESSTRHCLAERKRREKLNRKMEELRAIVGPLSSKTDKASIISAAIKLLLDKKRVCFPSSKEISMSLESQITTDNNLMPVSQLSNSMPAHNDVLQEDKNLTMSSLQKPSTVDMGEAQDIPSDIFCDLEAAFELEVNECSPFVVPSHKIHVEIKQLALQGQSYIVSIKALKGPGILSKIIFALSKLNLRVLFANSCYKDVRSFFNTGSRLTWLLAKVAVLDKAPNSEEDKRKTIYDAIKDCLS